MKNIKTSYLQMTGSKLVAAGLSLVLAVTMSFPAYAQEPEAAESTGQTQDVRPSDYPDQTQETATTQPGDELSEPVITQPNDQVPKSAAEESSAQKDDAFSVSKNNGLATLSQEGSLPLVTQGKSASEIVSQMSLKQQVEQMIVPAFRKWALGGEKPYNVTELNDEIRTVLAQHNFGGVILFGENFASTEQTVRLVDDFQRTSQSAGSLPLLISTDQEGGSVARLNSGTTFPGNMALAATGDTANATTVAQLMGKELSALGVNADYAPVLDVNNNPSNPVISVRSFSDDPQIVSKFGTAFLAGLSSSGVATTVKHFPGHGNTSTDSHTGLPLVNKTLDEIRACELIPFQAAIDAKADMIMTAHIQFPHIETGTYVSKKTGEAVYLPATLSKTIMNDVLRDEMGFEGVVSTDSLEMKAIAEHFDAQDAAALAVNAGVDILLMPVNMVDSTASDKMNTYVDGVVRSVEEGRISETRITESATRIVQLKLNRGIITDTPDPRTLEQKIAEAQGIVGSAQHHEVERTVTQKAVTVTQNKNYTLPLTPAGGQHVLMLSAFSNELPSLQYGFERLQREGVVSSSATYETLAYTNGANMDVVAQAIARADYVICISELNKEDELQPSSWVSSSVDFIINFAHESGVRVAVMSIEQPYDAARYPDADAFLIAYASGGMELDASGNPVGTYGPNIPTALDVIFGKVVPSGTLPVNIMALDENYHYTSKVLYPLGFGITNFDPPLPPPNPTPPDPKPVPVVDPTQKELAATGDTAVVTTVVLGFVVVCAAVACIAARRRSLSS